MKINWKVRFSNPVFIVQLILSVLTPILAYFGLEAKNIGDWESLFNILKYAVQSPYVLSLVVVSVWNCINDPTTQGISDSARALTYEKPSDGSEDDL